VASVVRVVKSVAGTELLSPGSRCMDTQRVIFDLRRLVPWGMWVCGLQSGGFRPRGRGPFSAVAVHVWRGRDPSPRDALINA
jgi:hypothetical protein